MSIKKKLLHQLQSIHKQLTLPHLSFTKLEKINFETKKYFDEALKNFEVKYKLLKKIDPRRDFINLWKHKGKQITLPINWRYLLSAPFIYGMIIPAIIWNIGIEVYHQICFRLYGIPTVKPKDFFVYDRQLLACLNLWEKLNCYYCSYVNNLIRYSAEIGGRTERYWCPIKYIRRMNKSHSQYDKFLSTKDEKEMRLQWGKLRDFSDIK